MIRTTQTRPRAKNRLGQLTMWQAHVVLLGARRGLTNEEALTIIPDFEQISKKTMRSCGLKWEDIESPYPTKTLNKLLALIRKDPEAFDELTQLSVQRLVSRN